MSKLAKALTAAAGNAGESLYVEDVFSTYLYEGNGAARTIDNNIALSDEGGLVWLKQRGALDSHVLFDTVNGPEASLSSNSADASSNYSSYLSFPSAGTTGWNLSGAILNGTGTTWASWTFRKAEKFFDVVTYTGTGSTTTVSHNLGSTPGFIIVKRTSLAEDWTCYHVGVPGTANYIQLNKNDAYASNSSVFNNTAPTDSVFTVGSSDRTNTLGETYVAYLFASDSGGFGDDGSESIIKCGSFTGNATVDVGFEPQWVMVKRTDNIGNWFIQDTMRGIPTGGLDASLFANLDIAESTTSNIIDLTATGFSANFGTGSETWIYIAIRRPMKTPESGTEVFSPRISSEAMNGNTVDLGITSDLIMTKAPTSSVSQVWTFDRLRGMPLGLNTGQTYAEQNLGGGTFGAGQTSVTWPPLSTSTGDIQYIFKRATGFFDVVAYTGTGSAHNEEHNLGVAPELMIVKARDGARAWRVYTDVVGNTGSLRLNADAAADSGVTAYWNNTTPTSSVFTVGTDNDTNSASYDYIAYLFATLDGVSKVGSYTGTGSNVDVDCGFSAGARFILIKRTDSTGDWYVWDSERGIVAGNDPYLLLNSTAAEVTSTDYIDPLSSGFTVTSSAPAALNASGGTYIFMAIS